MNLLDFILSEQTAKDKGLPLCYTSLKTVNARTDLINEKSKHYNDEHFLKAVVILGFFTAGQLKILADNENKKNFEVQPSKLLWIWIFGAGV